MHITYLELELVLCSGLFFSLQATLLGTYIYRKKYFLISSYPSVWPYVSARLSLEEFPSNLILETAMKMFQENLSLFTFGQTYRSLYVKT